MAAEILVWLLIVSPLTHRGGVPQVLERFKTQEQCMHVVRNMNEDKHRPYYSRCVQSRILVVKESAQ